MFTRKYPCFPKPSWLWFGACVRKVKSGDRIRGVRASACQRQKRTTVEFDRKRGAGGVDICMSKEGGNVCGDVEVWSGVSFYDCSVRELVRF